MKALLISFSNMGLDVEVLKEQAGLGSLDLSDPDARISCRYAANLFEIAKQADGRSDLGIRHGEAYQPFALGTVGLLLLSAPTMLEVTDHQLAESVFAAATNCIRILGGPHINPVEVRFTHKQSGEISVYRDLFKAPVVFSQKMNQIFFKTNQLDVSFLQANPRLFQLLEEHSQQQLKQLLDAHEFANTVRNAIFRSMNGQKVSAEIISGLLNMSPRSMQRKLQAEGVTFQKLMFDVRMDMAKNLLRAGTISVDELSYFLGFSEPSSFRKMFRKHAGISPSSYR